MNILQSIPFFNQIFPKQSIDTTSSSGSFVSTLKKVGKFAFYAFLLLNPSASGATTTNCVNGHCTRNLFQPVSQTPIMKYPEYMTHILQPGELLSSSGRTACALEELLPHLDRCDQESKLVEEVLLETIPNKHAALRDPKTGFNRQRVFFSIASFRRELGSKFKGFAFHLNPQEKKNLKEALTYLENSWLNNLMFNEMSEQQVIELLKTTHKKIFQNLPTSDGDTQEMIFNEKKKTVKLTDFAYKPGEFRAKDKLVFKIHYLRTLQKKMKEKGTKSDFKHFQTSISRAKKHVSNWLSTLTTNEKRVWNKIAYFAPPPSEIPSQFEVFAKEFLSLSKQVKDREIDAVEAAAKVHQNLVNLQPFFNGSDLLGRILLNGMLQLGGIPSISFPDIKEYQEAIALDRKKPGTFANYIAKTIRWNARQPLVKKDFHSKDILYPYTQSLSGRVKPISRKPLVKFANYLPNLLHPGMFISTNGKRFCMIQEKLPKQEVCDRESQTTISLTEKFDPDLLNEGKKKKRNKFVLDYKGAFIDISRMLEELPGYNPPFTKLGHNFPLKKRENYKNALQYLEKNWLSNPKFSELTPIEIVDSIKEINRLMLDGLFEDSISLEISENFVFDIETNTLRPKNEIEKPGSYRVHQRAVFDDRTHFSPEALEVTLRNNKGTESDVKNLHKSIGKANGVLPGKWASHLSTEERKAWEKIAYFPPPETEIPERMVNFAKQLKILIEKVKKHEIDVVAAAAKVHQYIANIHPFPEANGRLARALMNTILQLGGIPAVAFPSDRAYTEAIIKDQKNPGSFTDFLEEIIEWNAKQPLLENEFRPNPLR